MGKSGRYLFGMFASAALIVACAGELDAATQDEEGPSESVAEALTGVFRIQTRHSGLCLDVADASSSNSAPLVQYVCHGGNNQRFSFEDLGNGFHRIRAHHSGKCLDVINASASSGASIVQYDCHGGTNQEFELRPVGGGYVQIIPRNSSLCFDIAHAASANSAPLIQYTCHGGFNQMFVIN